MKRLAQATLAVALVTGAVGCGDQEHGQAPPWANGGTSQAPTTATPTTTVTASPAAPPAAATPGAPAAPAAAGAAQAPANEDAARAALLSKLKERKWSNEDFVESDTNRDPFHPFLVDIGQGEVPTPQYEILMSKYSLDELKLQAIVGPPSETMGGRTITRDSHVPARAMFIDPTGMGHAVVRGNHISRADAQVSRIDEEKGQVIVKLREELGNGKTRDVERVLELHTGPEDVNP